MSDLISKTIERVVHHGYNKGNRAVIIEKIPLLLKAGVDSKILASVMDLTEEEILRIKKQD